MPESGSHLIDRLHAALRHHPHLFGRKLDFAADDGVVVLTGTVNSYFQKQMAQEAIRRIEGVALIDNQLEVDCGCSNRRIEFERDDVVTWTVDDCSDYRGFGGVPMTASVSES